MIVRRFEDGDSNRLATITNTVSAKLVACRLAPSCSKCSSRPSRRNMLVDGGDRPEPRCCVRGEFVGL